MAALVDGAALPEYDELAEKFESAFRPFEERAPEWEHTLTLVCAQVTAATLSEAVAALAAEDGPALEAAYAAVAERLEDMDLELLYDGCVVYRVSAAGEGRVSVLPFGPERSELLGRDSFEPAAESARRFDGGGWLVRFAGADATPGLEDAIDRELCVYATTEAVYAGNKVARWKVCADHGGLNKSKDVPKLLKALPKLLKDLTWTGAPLKLTSYNVLLAGDGFPPKVLAKLPDDVGHCPAAAPADVYETFLERRKRHAELELLGFLADVPRYEETHPS